MINIRISKYNPIFRTADGNYNRREWTSVSDVGNHFDDGVLTLKDYLKIENFYVEAVQQFMETCAIDSLKITDLEIRSPTKNPKELETETWSWLLDLKEGAEVANTSLEKVIRAILREACWASLEGKNGSYIHFGYDYYIYISSNFGHYQEFVNKLPVSLYCDEILSPYLEDED